MIWSFHDLLGGGAWSFLVGGVNCLVNSDNERDLILLFNLLDILIHILSNIFIFYKIWINLNKFHKKIIHKI